MTEAQGPEQVDLRKYLAALGRRRLLITVVVLVIVLVTVGISLVRTPMYEAEAKVLLQPRGTGLFPSDSQLQLDPLLVVETEIEVLESDLVASAVVDQLGTVDTVAAERVGETLMIAVRARSESPQRAVEAANAYTQAYIEFRRQQGLDELEAAGRPIQDRIVELQSEVDRLDDTLQAPEGDDGSSQDVLRRRDALLIQLSRYSERLDELELETSANAGGTQLVSPAELPESPVSPRPARNGVLALVSGLILAVGLASVLEALDESVKTREDMRAATNDLPVLGVIPVFDRSARGSLAEEGSLVAEAYRMLRTSVQLLGVSRPLGTILVSSPTSGEGKTTTVANLAVVLASAGQRVAVVDFDLRRPTLHEVFGLSSKLGFTSLLLDEVPLAGALQPVLDDDRLVLLAAGHAASNPSELLSSKATAKLLLELKGKFDVVLIDCPPVLLVTDATLLAVWVDAVILVASADITSRKQLQRAMELLRQADAPLKGTVLNRTRAEQAQYYGYSPRRQEPAAERKPVISG